MTTRRFFLKSSGLALAGFGAAPSFLLRTAQAGTPAGGKDAPILLSIFQRGAADGISMVVPFGDPSYRGARPQIAIPEPKSGNAESALDLDGFFGLHPALNPLRPIYAEGHLAIVHAVGSPDSTRSHFDAQDYMESATPGNKGTATGWLNRYMQVERRDASPFRAVALAANMPRSLLGPAPALAMSSIAEFGLRPGSTSAGGVLESLYAAGPDPLLYDTGKAAFEAVRMLRVANPAQYHPAAGVVYPRTQYGQALAQVAQLIKADLGLEIAFAEIGGWDTHANQGAAQGQLALRLQELSQGLAAFYRDLGDRMRNIVVLTMTEFGRTIRQNGSGGTDHGHASALFVLGGPVHGGKVYGRWPGRGPEELYEGRDLALTTDFRNVFGVIAASHLRASKLDAIFPGFKLEFEELRGLIRDSV